MSSIENELNYLINPQYQNQINIKNNKSKITQDDILFYKKRIIQTAKNIINKTNDSYSSEITEIFNDFIELCIKHFKTIDTHDLIQTQFTTLINEPTNKNKPVSLNNDKNNDELLFNKKDEIKIEDCMKIKKINHVKKECDYPVKKNIDLKNPSLKLKGVKKKGNLEKKNIQ